MFEDDRSNHQNSQAESQQNPDDCSEENSDDDRQIKAYVLEFRQEVEKKFQASRTNRQFRFPRQTLHRPQAVPDDDASVDSLSEVTFYDLQSQNVKRELQEICHDTRASDTAVLVEVITKLGSLNKDFLQQQLSHSNSQLFQLLYQTVQRKANKTAHPPDFLTCFTSKTKPIILSNLKSHRSTVPKRADPCTDEAPAPKIQRVEIPRTERAMQIQDPSHCSSKQGGQSLSPRYAKKSSSVIIRQCKALQAKQQTKLRKNFSGSHCSKNSLSKPNLQAPCIKEPMNKNTTTAFNLLKKNLINVGNIRVLRNNKSKSKARDAPKLCIANINNLSSSNNQITMTKAQLRSLIRKNVNQGGADSATENQPVGIRAPSRSGKQIEGLASGQGPRIKASQSRAKGTLKNLY